MPAKIHFSKPSNQIGLIELDHQPANSLSAKMKILLDEILDKVIADNQMRVLIFTGIGEKFCTGDDLKEAMGRAGQIQSQLANLAKFGRLMDRIEQIEIPTIAAINGWCIGGGLELALCCDIRIAVDTAGFRGAGVNVGLTASGFRLPKIIGVGRAKDFLLTGKTIDAQTALDFGILTDVFTKEQLREEAMILAKTIASKAPLAVKATKAIIDFSLENEKAAIDDFAEDTLQRLARTKDYQNALKAFAKKETPKFIGE